jgi:hypothetical protein
LWIERYFGMAKKPNQGKGRGKGNLNVIIGTPNPDSCG